MIFKEEEIRNIISKQDVKKYLDEMKYKYKVIEKGVNKLYVIEDKLKLKCRTDISDILKTKYNIESKDTDKLIEIIEYVHELNTVGIDTVNKVFEDNKIISERIFITDCNNEYIQISYNLLNDIVVM